MSRSSAQTSGAAVQAPRSQWGILQNEPRQRRMLDFSVRVHQTVARVKVSYTVRNVSPHEAYLQNCFGPTQDSPLGTVGGGRSVNEVGERQSGFSSSSACAWPTKDGTLVLFQGEVAPLQTPAPSDWSEPAYARIGREESRFEIELGHPIRQWENNMNREADGPVVKVRRITLAIDVLLDPLTVVELPSARGVYACDYGQPGYLEATIELDKPIDIITHAGYLGRGEAKLASLKTLVRLGGPGHKAVAKLGSTP